MIVLPRQARDEHRWKALKKRDDACFAGLARALCRGDAAAFRGLKRSANDFFHLFARDTEPFDQDRLGTKPRQARDKKHNRRNPLNNSVGVRVFFSLHTLSITQEHFSDGGWVELGLDLPADDNDDEEEDDDDGGGADQADGWPADGDDGSDHDNGGGGGGGGGGARGKLREGVPR
eukprot:COSAG06_NODE_17067_length_965_cov_0.893519_1_plen_175_part_10